MFALEQHNVVRTRTGPRYPNGGLYLAPAHRMPNQSLGALGFDFVKALGRGITAAFTLGLSEIPIKGRRLGEWTRIEPFLSTVVTGGFGTTGAWNKTEEQIFSTAGKTITGMAVGAAMPNMMPGVFGPSGGAGQGAGQIAAGGEGGFFSNIWGGVKNFGGSFLKEQGMKMAQQQVGQMLAPEQKMPSMIGPEVPPPPPVTLPQTFDVPIPPPPPVPQYYGLPPDQQLYNPSPMGSQMWAPTLPPDYIAPPHMVTDPAERPGYLAPAASIPKGLPRGGGAVPIPITTVYGIEDDDEETAYEPDEYLDAEGLGAGSYTYRSGPLMMPNHSNRRMRRGYVFS